MDESINRINKIPRKNWEELIDFISKIKNTSKFGELILKENTFPYISPSDLVMEFGDFVYDKKIQLPLLRLF